MKRILFLVVAVMVLGGVSRAAERHVTTHGSCAIEGVTSEQAQTLALRRARSAAVEQAAGVAVTSSDLVRDGRLAGDFIKTFSRGYIVDESVTWEPVGQYQEDPAKPPVLIYRVRLDAVVEVPDGARPSLQLDAALNRNVYRADRDKLVCSVRTGTPARIAVFNITADDQVVMLYPDASRPGLVTDGRRGLTLPAPDEGCDIMVRTLPGHQRDTEALLVSAMILDHGPGWAEAFADGRAMPLTEFFRRYAGIAVRCEDVILSYEVHAQ